MTLFCLRILYRSVIVFVSLSALCDAPWWSVLSLRASHTLSHPHTKLWQQLGFTAPRPAGFTRQTDPSHRKPISQEQRGQVRACLECSPAPSGGWSPFSKPKRTCVSPELLCSPSEAPHFFPKRTSYLRRNRCHTKGPEEMRGHGITTRREG